MTTNEPVSAEGDREQGFEVGTGRPAKADTGDHITIRGTVDLVNVPGGGNTMRRRILSFALGVSIRGGLAGTTRTAAIEGRTGGGLFSGLRVGQPVTLKDLGAAYEVGVMGDRFPTGREVAEVGADCLVVRDVTGVVEPRIPVTSIKAVTRIMAPSR